MKSFFNGQKLLLGGILITSALLSQTFQVEENKWRLIGATADIPLNQIVGEECLAYMFYYEKQKYEKFTITPDITKVVKPQEAFFLISKKGNCTLISGDNAKSTPISENPFKGITTSKGTEKNLFPIKVTGVSTAPIKEMADQFLESLNEQQRSKTTFDIQDGEWFKWSNVDNGMYKRQGVSLKEMTAVQKQKAFALLQESLSVKGLQLSKDIMKTDQTLREFKNGDPDYDEELYFITIMGNPSLKEPWGGNSMDIT